jgi:hypothetical protein
MDNVAQVVSQGLMKTGDWVLIFTTLFLGIVALSVPYVSERQWGQASVGSGLVSCILKIRYAKVIAWQDRCESSESSKREQ